MGWQPFGAVHGLLRCHINIGVHAHARGADVSLRDVTIAQMGNGASKCEWRHAPEARGGFWDFEKVSELSWILPREKTVDFRLLAEALGRCHACWRGGRWKIQNRKNVYLSPYVEKPLNSKVIKSFVPELRSRKCFSCFEIPMFYVYMLWTLYVHFIHRRIWLWYRDRSGVHPFDEIPAAEIGFEKISLLSEILFFIFIFFFHLRLSGGVCF